MHISDDERERIARRLDSVEDTATAVIILEALYTFIAEKTKAASSGFAYVAHATSATSATYTLHITGVPFFFHEYVRAIVSASARVVRVTFTPTSVDVEVARSSQEHSEMEHYVPSGRKRRRQVPTDYAAANVSADDQAVIDAIVGDMYNSMKRMPEEMSYWFEPIGGGGTGDDESESSVGGAVQGYCICFKNLPNISYALMTYLTTEYAATIASIYMWYAPPARVHTGSVLVINIRAAKTPVTTTRRLVKTHIPRGIDVPSPSSSSSKRSRVL